MEPTMNLSNEGMTKLNKYQKTIKLYYNGSWSYPFKLRRFENKFMGLSWALVDLLDLCRYFIVDILSTFLINGLNEQSKRGPTRDLYNRILIIAFGIKRKITIILNPVAPNSHKKLRFSTEMGK